MESTFRKPVCACIPHKVWPSFVGVAELLDWKDPEVTNAAGCLMLFHFERRRSAHANTCVQVVAWIRRILRVEKTGHSGTLDPKVTGVAS